MHCVASVQIFNTCDFRVLLIMHICDFIKPHITNSELDFLIIKLPLMLCAFIFPQNPHVYVQIPVLLAGNSQDQVSDSKVTPVSTVYDEVLIVNTSDIGISSPADSFNESVSLNETSSLQLLDPALVPSDDADMSSLTSSSDPEVDVIQVGPQDMKTGQSSAYPPLPLSENQLEALNISSHYFSKFSKPLNISSKTLLSLPSSLDVSARHLFPFVQNSLTPGPVTPLPRQNNMYVIMYRNGRLFPVIQSDLSDGAFRKGNWAVVTPVIAVSSGKIPADEYLLKKNYTL